MEDDKILEMLTDEQSFEDAQYNGEAVVLNKPFALESGAMRFGVYAKNANGDVVSVSFCDRSIDFDLNNVDSINRSEVESSDPSTPIYWSQKIFGHAEEFCDRSFESEVFIDMADKSLYSVRDGVQEYLGIEVGQQPIDRTFTYYRSPETITSMLGSLDGIPIIDEHIDPKTEPRPEDILGVIKSTQVEEFIDSTFNTTLRVKNKVVLNDKGLSVLKGGKNKLSLGYLGKVRKHDRFDFEQYDVKPTHLAMVSSARGGDGLSFTDKGNKTMDEVFKDADGNLSMQRIVDIVMALPEAIKEMPIDRLQELAPVLEEMMTMTGGEAEASEMPEGGQPEEMPEEQPEEMPEEEQVGVTDSAEFKDALTEGIKSGVKLHAEVTDKARKFLPDDFSFADKSPTEIMRETLKRHTGESFTDAELSVAFKMLKADNKYKSFGDSSTDNTRTKFTDLADKEY